MIRKTSLQYHSETENITPGGVSSPVRAFDPYPIYMGSGAGCLIKDIDGNEYVDLCMAYGPLILGHAHPSIISAVTEQLKKGSVFGTPSVPETDLIKTITEKVPCAEMVRLVNSGTEAVMHSVRLARGYTGRNGIVKMKGGFHGSCDSMLSDRTQSSSKNGITEYTAYDTYAIEYNSVGQMESVLEGGNIAAVIMEPVMGNAGVILPEKDYLKKVRKMTEKEETLLIFDEVITGFRLSEGGAQEKYGIIPDICTMGKIMGGGLPAGAFAGRKDIMMHLSPTGPVVQTGTFSGNPVTAAAGLAALTEMTEKRYEDLDKSTEELVSSLSDSMNDRNITGTVNRAGSMFQMFFGVKAVKNGTEAQRCDRDMYTNLFRRMLDAGVYMPPAALEVNFTSTEHHKEDNQKISEEFDNVLRCMK